MGATCYMNVILQSFIHNPMLRNYFLSDRHNPSLCTNRENCLACELDTVFNAVSVHKQTRSLCSP
jgi:ubiquitin carboxyl-terminal hydrolase 22/27/51